MFVIVISVFSNRKKFEAIWSEH